MPSMGSIASYASSTSPVAYGAVVGEHGAMALFLTLVLIVVVAFIRGDVVPRKTHEDVILQGVRWQEAHAVSEQARQEERNQKRELLEIGRANAAIVASLPRVVAQDRDS